MDWTQLKSFYYIAKLGSITKASEAIHRSQSAVSQQLRLLEESMGLLLFERVGKKKMVLTRAGQRLLQFAEETFQAVRQLEDDFESFKGHQQGHVRLSAASTTLGVIFADSIAEFIRTYPEASITLYDRFPGQALEMLSNGLVDLAISLESQASNCLNKFRWMIGHFVLMVPTGHPLTKQSAPVSLGDIARYPFIKMVPNSKFAATHKIEQAFMDNGLRFKLFLEAGNTHLIGEYIRRGLGISVIFVPKNGLNLFPGELEFIPLDHLFKPEAITICSRKNTPLPPLAETFLKMVMAKADLD